MKKISFIIPAFNCDKYIINCLKSINCQMYNDYEVIIIDDGSIDNTNSIVKEYIKDKPNYKLITTNNNGVSHARNIGIDNSNGLYLMFIDSDDLLVNGSIKEIKKIIKKENFDLYQFSIMEFINNYNLNEDNNLNVVKLINKNEAIKKLLLGGKFKEFEILASPCSKIYKKSIIDKYSIRFNEKFNMFEDGIFNIEYLNYCNKVYSSNKVLYLYRRDVSTSLTRKIDQNILDQKQLQINYLNTIVDNKCFDDYAIKIFSFNSIKSIFRCYIYHPSNKMNYKERVNEIKKIINIDCFKEPLNSRKIYKYLDKKSKILFYLFKKRLFFIIDMIYKRKYKYY